MSYDPDRLYRMLPSVYQRRDAQIGEPLRALLGVISEQVDIVESDIAQLYDDWFIETCQDWVVGYLGDLVGYQLLHSADEALGSDSAEARQLLARVVPRRDVAHTVANRRRKGSLALLEELAADVAGWPARAVEFRRLLALTQPVRLFGSDARAQRRRHPDGRLADLRAGDQLDRLDGPFDSLAHTVTVSRISSHRRQRTFDVDEVGLYLWRLAPYSITHGPAFCQDRDRAHYTFSVLGNDTPLVTKPVREPAPTHLADASNVPANIGRRAFAERAAHYYGPLRSLYLWVDDTPIPLSRIVPADLTGWRYRPSGDQVALDPVLGRIAFPARRSPDKGVWVSYHQAFSADLGGGEYPRPIEVIGSPTIYRVGPGADAGYRLISDAVSQWRADIAGAVGDVQAALRHAVIEITDTGEYHEQLEIPLDHGDCLTLRAAQGKRPAIRLLNWHGNQPDALRITGTGQGDGPLPTMTLDGLLVTGRSVRVQGEVGQVRIRHCTLVPGWSLDENCCAEHADEPSLELFDTPACVQIEHSILGTILVNENEVATEPNRIYLSDSILDAAGAGLDAVLAPDGRHAYAEFNALRSTVFGAVRAHAVGRLENCILDGDVQIARRQAGCVRFCWLSPGSRTPARFHCEPETSGAPERVLPLFASTRYGTPDYAQLDLACADEIRRGADDGSELGAFHDLFQPQREDNLRLRLAEYTPAGCAAGIIFVT